MPSAKNTPAKGSTDWLTATRCKVDDAIRTIQRAKKQRSSDYDLRLRKLRTLSDQLFIRSTSSQEAELFNAEQLLTPDLATLVTAPLRGLD